MDDISNKEAASIDTLSNLDPSFQEKLLIRILENNPSIKAKMLKKYGTSVVRERHTYYSEESALMMKRTVDEMIIDEEDVIIKYSDYEHQWSKNTTRMRVFNGISYLVEQMDEDGKYKEWWSKIKIQDVKEDGVTTGLLIRNTGSTYNKAKNGAIEIFGHKASMPKEADTSTVGDELWKNRIMEFIGNEEESTIKMKELRLTGEDKDWIRNMFLTLPNYVVIVKTETIFLQKLTPNQVFEGEKVRIF